MRPPQIRVHATLEAAERDWATPGLAGYAFGSFAWLRAWYDTMGIAAGILVAMVVVTDGDGAVLLCLPLGVSRARTVRTLGFLGGVVTDYNAPLVDPGFAAGLDAAAATALWRAILQALPPHDVIRFDRMPSTLDPPAGAGEPATPNPLALLPGLQDAGMARSATLPASHAAFLATLRVKFVADTKRCQRRLAELGPVDLRVATTAPEMQATLDTLFEMKSRRWRETHSKDWAAEPSFRAFYQAVSASGLAGGRVHGSTMTVGATVVAAHWGLIYRARFYYLIPGWAAGDWTRYAPGRLMTDALIQQALEGGVRVFDFTVGDEGYKQNWVDTDLPLLSYVAASTRRGRAALAAARLAGALRARAKNVTWLRTLVRRARSRPA